MEEFSLPVLVFISFPEAILMALLGLSIIGIRPTIKQLLLFGSAQAIFGVTTRMLPFPFGIHSILQFVTFSVLVYLIMFIPYRISLLVTLLGFIISGIAEAIPVFLLFKLTGLDLSDLLHNGWLRVYFFIPSAITAILVILLIHRFDDKLAKYRSLVVTQEPNRSLKTEKSFNLVSLFLFYNLLVFVLLTLFYMSTGSGSVPKTIISVHSLLTLLIAILSMAMVIIIRRVLALIEDEAEAEAKLDSLQHVEELVGTIRAQRHDFGHHLQVAYGLLEVEAYQEAKQYIKNNVSEIATTLELVKTDNLGITALLYTKSGLAELKDIALGVRIETSLKHLPLESRDANIILGNLLDNAFEAASLVPVDKRHVTLTVSRNQEDYIFEVKNSGSPIDPELIDSIFTPDFSTKGEGRGVGLYSVKRLVDKYDGKIEVTSDSDYVSFRVYIPYKN
ncbi:MAG TPA: GHKL domain-containing protein [Anaerolineae bacterium]|nr:GHKL domain-containing protein [Anaerolineae bacterium]